jgi:hypothetical protein
MEGGLILGLCIFFGLLRINAASRNYMTQPRLLLAIPKASQPKRRFSNAIAILAIFTAVFFAVDARGYVGEGASWPNGSTVTFQFALGGAGRTLLDGNTSWDTAAMPAPSAWNSNVQGLRFVGVVNGNAPLSSGDGINTIAFSNTIFGQSFGSSTLAVTYYRYYGGTMSEADVLFNIHQSFDSYRGPLRFGSNGYAIADIRRVLIHELGHALGLAHPDQNGQRVDAIMNSVISNRETVSQDDINGAHALYGAPQSSPSPTPTPTPVPTPIPAATPRPTPTPRPVRHGRRGRWPHRPRRPRAATMTLIPGSGYTVSLPSTATSGYPDNQ